MPKPARNANHQGKAFVAAALTSKTAKLTRIAQRYLAAMTPRNRCARFNTRFVIAVNLRHDKDELCSPQLMDTT